jgi:hypothetical protein
VGHSQDLTSLSKVFKRRPPVLAIMFAPSVTSALTSNFPPLSHRLTGAASC